MKRRLLSFAAVLASPFAAAQSGALPPVPASVVQAAQQAPNHAALPLPPPMPISRPHTARHLDGPYRSPDDPTLVTYGYNPDVMYPVTLEPNQETHLVFAPDEVVLGVYLSNTGRRWLYHIALTQRDVFIEARMPDLRNAATVITSRRQYELDLRSSDHRRADHRVSWTYPGIDAGSNAAPLAALGTDYPNNMARHGVVSSDGPRIDPTRLHLDYRIEGHAPFAPLQVFDDGRFTYLQLPHDTRLPAVMVLDQYDSGEIADLIPLGNDFYKVPQITEYGLLLVRDHDTVRVLHGSDRGCGLGCAGPSGRSHDDLYAKP